MAKENGGLTAAAEAFGSENGGGGFAASLVGTDFSKVSDGGGALLEPKVDHIFLISNVKAQQSSTGNHMIVLRLSCETPGAEGTTVFDNVVNTEKAQWKVKSLLKATGFLDANGVSMLTNEQDLVGCRVVAQVKHETYEGVTRNKIASAFSAV